MIKSVIDNKEVKKELPFPKLMIADCGKVVLFSEKERGVTVLSGKNNFESDEVGHISNEWNMVAFKDFHGSITLSNEE